MKDLGGVTSRGADVGQRLATDGDGHSLAERLRDNDGTRERILRAAVTVIRSVGNGQFSVQKVARVAGVYQGNITYYWPRRRDLVVALAGRIVAEYRAAFLSALTGLDREREDWAETLMRWVVEDAVSEDRVRLLPELWSMANADADVATEVTKVYEDVTEAILQALGIRVDDPGHARLRVALLLAFVSAQGLTAAHGHRLPEDPVLTEVREALIALHAPRLVEALAGVAQPAR
jgi:AcrR family transcriptional regulator